MQHLSNIHATTSGLMQLLDELSAGIDPAFDTDTEELERQFAELRVTFDHN